MKIIIMKSLKKINEIKENNGFLYMLVALGGILVLLIMFVILLPVIIIGTVISYSAPTMYNGDINNEEVMAIYEEYINAENKTYIDTGIHTDVALMVTTDMYITDNNFNKVDKEEIQSYSDMMVAKEGSIINEDLNKNNTLDEFEDSNDNQILDENTKILHKQVYPPYNYLKLRLEDEKLWNSFEKDYEKNMSEFYEIYKIQTLVFDSFFSSVGGILGIPIIEPYTITAGYNSDDGVHNGDHNGVDFVYTGSEVPKVIATEKGEVIRSHEGCDSPGGGLGDLCGEDPFLGAGNHVVIKHGTGSDTFYSLYGHMEKTLVENGDIVKKGQPIGVQGSSGNSTGSHLHFSIFKVDENGFIKFYDPSTFLTGGGVITEDKEKMMKEAGIKKEDYFYVDYIIEHESSWNYQATNKDSGAYGLCQALPPEKMESAGSDWKTNPITQLKWCDGYAIDRYTSWEEAYKFWKENEWW